MWIAEMMKVHSTWECNNACGQNVTWPCLQPPLNADVWREWRYIAINALPPQ